MAAAAPSAAAGGSAPQPSLGTLQVILCSEVLLKAFEEFARKERNEENLILLAKIADFKRSDVAGKTARTAEIAKMIKSGTVNASAKTRSSLDSSVAKLRGWETTGTPSDSPDVTRELESVEATLLLLETTVHRELVGDALPRFLRSPQYAAASAEVAASAKPRRESLARGLLKSLGSSMKALAPGTPAAGGPGAAAAPAAPSPSASQTPLPYLSLGGVSERKQALLDLLGHSAACSVFVEFCRREHNDENVECLLDLQALRRLETPESRRRKAREVLDTYIKGGSAKEANVDSRTRAAAELWLARCAASGAALDSAELADAVSESWEVGGTLLAPPTTSSGSGGAGGSPDPLGKVELELINMLSGEVLPRFVASRMWTDFVSSYPGGQYRAPGGAGGVSLPPGGPAALAQSLSIASLGDLGSEGGASGAAAGSAAAGSAASAASAGTAEKSSGGFFGFRRKDKDKAAAAGGSSAAGGGGGHGAEGPATGESASAAAAHKLRDKIYLFGVSLKPRLFGSKKASELEAAGSAIKGAEIKGGFLLKRAHHKSSWKRRWFVLSPFALAYYDTNTAAAPNGVILTSEITAVSAWWDPTLCKGAPPGTAGTGGGASSAAAAAGGGGGGGGAGGSGSAGSGTRPTSTRPGDGSCVDVLGAHAVPPPPDVSSLSSAFFVYTAHRPYTFQAANDRDRLRWLYALDHARRGDVDAVKAAERTGYAGLEGSTLAAWLLSRAQTYAPPPPGACEDGLGGLGGLGGDDGDGDGSGDGGGGDGDADDSLFLALGGGSDDDAASAGGGSAPGSARSRPQSLGSPLRPQSLPAGVGAGSSSAGSVSRPSAGGSASGFSDADTDGGSAGGADSSRASVRRSAGSALPSTAEEGAGRDSASAPGGSGFADGRP